MSFIQTALLRQPKIAKRHRPEIHNFKLGQKFFSILTPFAPFIAPLRGIYVLHLKRARQSQSPKQTVFVRIGRHLPFPNFRPTPGNLSLSSEMSSGSHGLIIFVPKEIRTMGALSEERLMRWAALNTYQRNGISNLRGGRRDSTFPQI